MLSKIDLRNEYIDHDLKKVLILQESNITFEQLENLSLSHEEIQKLQVSTKMDYNILVDQKRLEFSRKASKLRWLVWTLAKHCIKMMNIPKI